MKRETVSLDGSIGLVLVWQCFYCSLRARFGLPVVAVEG